MTILSVALPLDDPPMVDLHRAVLASVPSRLRISDDAGGDIRLVSGRTPGWVERAEKAIAEGVRAVVLTRPYVVELTRLQKLATQAEAAQVVVAVDSPYACDQTWTSALPRVKETLTAAAVLDSVITVARTGPSEARLDGALLDQLAVVRPLLAAADLGLAAYHSDRHYVLAGGVDGIAVTLTGIVAPLGDEGMRLDLIGVEQHWRAHFDAQGPARPTSVTLFDADGEHSSRPLYESGRRDLARAARGAGERHAGCLHHRRPHRRPGSGEAVLRLDSAGPMTRVAVTGGSGKPGRAVYPLDERRTRLVSRWGEKWPRTPATVFWLLISAPGSFIMERRMLRGIRTRVERAGSTLVSR